MRCTVSPGIPYETHAGSQDVPGHLGQGDRVSGVAVERVPVKTGGPARADPLCGSDDAVVFPTVDDAVDRRAPLAEHAENLEGHTLAPREDDHSRATDYDPR